MTNCYCSIEIPSKRKPNMFCNNYGRHQSPLRLSFIYCSVSWVELQLYLNSLFRSIFFIVIILAFLSAIVDYFIIPENSVMRLGKFRKSFPLHLLTFLDTRIQLFFAFSFYRNVKEIISVGKSNRQGQIELINFIRFYSIVVVIISHVFVIAMINIS